MKRRLFNLLAVVSLVLCVATVALWIRTQFVSYQFVVREEAAFSYHSVGAAGDALFVSYRYIGFSSEPPPRWWLGPPFTVGKWIAESKGWYLAGFGLGKDDWSWIFGVPHWFAVAISFCAFPVFLRLGRSGFKIGHCTRCDYDLRASKERCPECGTAIPAGGGEAK